MTSPVDSLTAQKNSGSNHLISSLLYHISTNMKRKTDETGSNANGLPESKKRALSTEEAVSRFRDGLFDTAEQQKYTDEYAKSNPYVFFFFYL